MPVPSAIIELRPLLHLALHIVVPALVAAMFYRKRWLGAWLWLLAGWVIDLDHLLADPIYAPGRCSIGFHLTRLLKVERNSPSFTGAPDFRPNSSRASLG